jgi:hypothetical protein
MNSTRSQSLNSCINHSSHMHIEETKAYTLSSWSNPDERRCSFYSLKNIPCVRWRDWSNYCQQQHDIFEPFGFSGKTSDKDCFTALVETARFQCLRWSNSSWVKHQRQKKSWNETHYCLCTSLSNLDWDVRQKKKLVHKWYPTDSKQAVLLVARCS